jgi:hypothetical protein
MIYNESYLPKKDFMESAMNQKNSFSQTKNKNKYFSPASGGMGMMNKLLCAFFIFFIAFLIAGYNSFAARTVYKLDGSAMSFEGDPATWGWGLGTAGRSSNFAKDGSYSLYIGGKTGHAYLPLDLTQWKNISLDLWLAANSQTETDDYIDIYDNLGGWAIQKTFSLGGGDVAKEIMKNFIVTLRNGMNYISLNMRSTATNEYVYVDFLKVSAAEILTPVNPNTFKAYADAGLEKEIAAGVWQNKTGSPYFQWTGHYDQGTNNFKFYRLYIHDNYGDVDITQLAEFTVYDTEGNPINYGSTVTASGENLPNEGKDKAVDNNTSTKWLVFTGQNAWITCELAAPQTTGSYSITSANDVPDRDPMYFSFQGSNDGAAWVTLDVRNNVRFDSRYQKINFNTSVPAYTSGLDFCRIRYRIEAEINNAAYNVQIPYSGSLPITFNSSGDPLSTHTESGIYYLNIRSWDKDVNYCDWDMKVFELKYDITLPPVPADLGIFGWTNNPVTGDFDFEDVTDAHSGFREFDIYAGTDPAGEVAHLTQVASIYPSVTLTDDGIYYLRVRSRDNAGNNSAWATIAEYRFDKTAPGKTNTKPLVNWTNDATPGLIDFADASDTHSGVKEYDIYWGISSTGTTVTAVRSVSSYDPGTIGSTGIYYLRARARDNAGNNGAWADVLEYRFDKTPPSDPVYLSLTDWTNNTSPGAFDFADCTDSDSGIKNYDIYWGTLSTGTSVTATVAASSYDPGVLGASNIYFLRGRSRDNAGNLSAWKTIAEYRLDINIPGVLCSNISNNENFSGSGGVNAWPVTITGSASDTGGSGLAANITLRLKRDSDGNYWNGTAFQSGLYSHNPVLSAGAWSFDFAPAVNSEINYTLELISADTAGNSSNQVSVPFAIDNRPPEYTNTFTWADQGLNTADTQKVNASVALTHNDGSVHAYTFDITQGVGISDRSGSSASQAWTNVPDSQTIKITFTVTDGLGNSSSQNNQITISDRTAPVISSAARANGDDMYYMGGDSFAMSLSGSDTIDPAASLTAKIDFTPFVPVLGIINMTNNGNGTFSYDSGAVNGADMLNKKAQNLVFTLLDSQGNSTTSQFAITTDTVKPSLTAQVFEYVQSDEIYKADENLSLQVELNDNFYPSNLTVTADLSPLAPGYSAAQPFSFYQTTGKYRMVKYLALADNFNEGSHTVAVTASDPAGNICPDSIQMNVIFDRTAPVFTDASITDPDNYYKAGDTISLSASLTDNIPLENEKLTVTADLTAASSQFTASEPLVHQGGGVYTLTTGTLNSINMNNGEHTVPVSARDRAGNVKINSTIKVKIDKTAPSIDTVVQSDPDRYYKSGDSVNMNVNISDIPFGSSELTSKISFAALDSAYPAETDLIYVNTTLFTASAPQALNSATLVEGWHTLPVNTNDIAGNSTVHNSFEVLVDNQAPVFDTNPQKIAATDPDRYYKPGDTINLTVDLSDQFFHATFGDEADNLTVTADLTGLSAQFTANEPFIHAGAGGIYELHTAALIQAQMFEGQSLSVPVTARDRAGNSALNSTLTLQLDKTAPVIAGGLILDPDEFYKAGDTIGVSLEATDNFDTDQLSVKGDFSVLSSQYSNQQLLSNGGAGSDFTVSLGALVSGSMIEGRRTVTFTATDLAGNIGYYSTLEFQIDKTQPQFTSVSVTDSDIYYKAADTITLKAVLSDIPGNLDRDHLDVTVDLSALSPGQAGFTGAEVLSLSAAGTYTLTTPALDGALLSEGQHTLTVTASDRAGNVNTHSTFSIFIDNTPPIVTDLIINYGKNSNQDQVTSSTNSNAWNSAPDKTFEIYACTTDTTAGPKEGCTVEVSLANASQLGGSSSISLVYNAARSRWEGQFTAAGLASTNTTAAPHDPADTTTDYTKDIVFVAQDKAGNVSAPANLNVLIDTYTMAPVTPVINYPAGQVMAHDLQNLVITSNIFDYDSDRSVTPAEGVFNVYLDARQININAPYSAPVLMNDDGLNGDAVAGDEIYSVTIPVDIAETAPVTKSVGVFYIDKAKNVSVTTSQTVKIDNQIIAPQGVTVVYPTNQTQIKRGDTFKVYALIPEVDSVPLGGSGVDTVQFYGRAGSELAAVYPAAANLYMLAESACGIDWDGDSLLEDNIFGISLTAPAGGFPVIDESTDNFAVRVIDNTGLIAQTDSTLKIDDQILNPADFVFHYLINGLFRAKNGDACNISFKLPEYDAGVRTVTLDLSSMGGGIITSCQNEADAGLDWNQAAPAGQTDIWGMNFTVNDTPDTENIVRNITVEYTDFAGNSSGITDIDVYIDNLARYTSFRILYPSGKEQIRLNDGVTIEVFQHPGPLH